MQLSPRLLLTLRGRCGEAVLHQKLCETRAQHEPKPRFPMGDGTSSLGKRVLSEQSSPRIISHRIWKIGERSTGE